MMVHGVHGRHVRRRATAATMRLLEHGLPVVVERPVPPNVRILCGAATTTAASITRGFVCLSGTVSFLPLVVRQWPPEYPIGFSIDGAGADGYDLSAATVSVGYKDRAADE